MFVRPDRQSCGIGCLCLRELLRRAEAGAKPVCLQVLRVNERAAAFYRRFGFAVVGGTDSHLEMERS
jgi:ribosomal protein S18 acetylase RimI-like enzyme